MAKVLTVEEVELIRKRNEERVHLSGNCATCEARLLLESHEELRRQRGVERRIVSDITELLRQLQEYGSYVRPKAETFTENGNTCPGFGRPHGRWTPGEGIPPLSCSACAVWEYRGFTPIADNITTQKSEVSPENGNSTPIHSTEKVISPREIRIQPIRLCHCPEDDEPHVHLP